jgi:hypothetical protein
MQYKYKYYEKQITLRGGNEPDGRIGRAKEGS